MKRYRDDDEDLPPETLDTVEEKEESARHTKVARRHSPERASTAIVLLGAVDSPPSVDVILRDIRSLGLSSDKDLDETITIEMNTGKMFKNLLICSTNKFKSGAFVNIQIGGVTYATMKLPHFIQGEGSKNHPYCYPITPATGEITTTNVTYEDIGKQLAKCSPDFLDCVLTVAIRVMKCKDTPEDYTAMIALAEYVAVPVTTTRWHTLSILCVLIGAAAAESGRGIIGYVNVLAAFHNLKHAVRFIWNEWMSTRPPGSTPPTPVKNATQSVFPSSYDATEMSDTRISLGFSGSQQAIKNMSRPSTMSSSSSSAVVPPATLTSRMVDSYPYFTRRDIELFRTWERRSYPFHGSSIASSSSSSSNSNSSSSSSQTNTFQRKVMAYLLLLFPPR